MTERAVYDVAIIGSGPAAVAALDALDRSKKIAVVTGAVPSIVSKRLLHPKIRAVADGRGRHAGLAEPITQGRGNPLFSSAEVGGFANYWGQQFVRYSAPEISSDGLFRSHSDYEAECSTIERLFSIRGGDALSSAAGDGFRITLPRLLTGSADHTGAGLDAMGLVYRKSEKALGCVSYETRAVAFYQDKDDWRISLENGQSIAARKIILAAGVKGTAHIMLRSFSDLRTVRFNDHSPWIVHVIGLKQFMRSRPASAFSHFNAMTLENVQNDKCVSFASVYDLSAMDLNLLLLASTGRGSSLLRNRRLPRAVSYLNVVQVWTPTSRDIIEIDAKAGSATAGPRDTHRSSDDTDLGDVQNFLRLSGARVMKISRTSSGFGFHYHGLRVRAPGGTFQSVSDLLLERTSGIVTCVDASMMPLTGSRPLTLTVMAAARRRTANILAGM